MRGCERRRLRPAPTAAAPRRDGRTVATPLPPPRSPLSHPLERRQQAGRWRALLPARPRSGCSLAVRASAAWPAARRPLPSPFSSLGCWCRRLAVVAGPRAAARPGCRPTWSRRPSAAGAESHPSAENRPFAVNCRKPAERRARCQPDGHRGQSRGAGCALKKTAGGRACLGDASAAGLLQLDLLELHLGPQLLALAPEPLQLGGIAAGQARLRPDALLLGSLLRLQLALPAHHKDQTVLLLLLLLRFGNEHALRGAGPAPNPTPSGR